MRSSTAMAILALAVFVTACGAQAQTSGTDTGTTTTPQIGMTSVPTGTEIKLALDTPVNSLDNSPGDPVTARVVEPVTINGKQVIPAGAKVEGKVTEAVPAKKGRGKGKVAVQFDQLRLDSGYRTNITGSFEEVSASKTKDNAKIIGGSAVGGAILGRIFGKGTKAAVVGSIIGGAAGTAVVMSKEGQQASMKADTPFVLKLDQPVSVPRAS